MSSDSVLSTDLTTTRITNPRTLTLARVGLVIFAVLMIALNLLALPQVFDRPICQNAEPGCENSLRSISQDTVDLLTSAGIDYHIYVTIESILTVIIYIVLLIIAGFLFWQRSDDRMVLILTAQLSCFGGFSPIVSAVSSITVSILVLTFPTGSFKPRWSILIVAVLFVQGVTEVFKLSQESSELGSVIFLAMVAATLGIVIYRYRRLFTVSQRQQAKWLLFSVGVIILYWLTNLLLIFPLLNALGNGILITLHFLAFNFFALALDLLIPISLWIAITRYRLFDLRFVINRSLVYGIVTVVLLIVFSLLFVVAHTVLSSVVSGQQGFIAGAIAVATPVLLFNPVRHIVGHFVDHRIFRLRYDLSEVAAAQKPPEIKNPGIYTGHTFGKYQVLGVLGKGGMGEVYQATGAGQTVALKVLPADLAQQDEFRKRFAREAQTLATLQHPNIVKLYDSGVTDDGVHYLAMEYIDGQELSAVIDKGAMTDYDVLREWMRSVVSALDYIHEKGLVHRDLKPSNIMLRPSARDNEIQETVLMDFGIARTDATGTRITGSGTVGTIDYMSPEQIMAAREVDRRSDVYSLGIIVYELLTGETPFKGSAGQVLFAHLQQPAPDPRDVNTDVPHDIAHAVMQSLSKKPEDRYPSAGEFAAALGVSSG
ncbi:MAG: protein kinase [Anaerolineae bacterium]|nr:protein kinase [Anaerolineae bacterium]